MKRTHFYFGTAIIIIPIVLFFFLNTGKSSFNKLPIYGERVAPNGMDVLDTIYYSIPDFKVLTHLGDSISQKDLNDGIYLANFFFATCKDVCPTMNRRLKDVYEEVNELMKKNQELVKENPKAKMPIPVRFISFTVDPQNDTLAALAEYAKRFEVKDKNWLFTRTEKEQLFQIGRGFLLPVSIEDRTIDHSQQVLLIDRQNRIRGMYDALSDTEIKRLKDEIKVLLYEYHEQQQSR